MNNFENNVLVTLYGQLLKKVFHPYNFSTTLILNEKPILIEWTERANTMLQSQNKVLTIELQLYFACMVTKRIAFHYDTKIVRTAVNSKLAVAFNAIQSTVCCTTKSNTSSRDTILTSEAAMNMHPSTLQFDYHHDAWNGSFFI